ncbi:MAG: hypothetical protein NMNS02_18150 [Nitrosomonas sp.]|nr:MAG: hypothetical protein NMNS02_18150 [Nitrosomonas sp.]
MALIHQILYESSDFSRVDFSTVIESLVNNLSLSYALDSSKITVNVETDPVFLPIDTSIPLGLIINELCANAMKYAFGKQPKGNINIRLEHLESDVLRLQITDDGVGIPEDFDIENASSLGLQLVHLLSEQISAELRIQRSNPTSFTLVIPI